MQHFAAEIHHSLIPGLVGKKPTETMAGKPDRKVAELALHALRHRGCPIAKQLWIVRC